MRSGGRRQMRRRHPLLPRRIKFLRYDKSKAISAPLDHLTPLHGGSCVPKSRDPTARTPVSTFIGIDVRYETPTDNLVSAHVLVARDFFGKLRVLLEVLGIASLAKPVIQVPVLVAHATLVTTRMEPFLRDVASLAHGHPGMHDPMHPARVATPWVRLRNNFTVFSATSYPISSCKPFFPGVDLGEILPFQWQALVRRCSTRIADQVVVICASVGHIGREFVM